MLSLPGLISYRTQNVLIILKATHSVLPGQVSREEKKLGRFGGERAP